MCSAVKYHRVLYWLGPYEVWRTMAMDTFNEKALHGEQRMMMGAMQQAGQGQGRWARQEQGSSSSPSTNAKCLGHGVVEPRFVWHVR